MEKIILTENDYIFNEKTGDIVVNKHLINYCENQKYYPIHFTDSVEDIVYIYKERDSNHDNVVLEYLCTEDEFVTM